MLRKRDHVLVWALSAALFALAIFKGVGACGDFMAQMEDQYLEQPADPDCSNLEEFR